MSNQILDEKSELSIVKFIMNTMTDKSLRPIPKSHSQLDEELIKMGVIKDTNFDYLCPLCGMIVNNHYNNEDCPFIVALNFLDSKNINSKEFVKDDSIIPICKKYITSDGMHSGYGIMRDDVLQFVAKYKKQEVTPCKKN